jgi:PKD domain-containing protein
VRRRIEKGPTCPLTFRPLPGSPAIDAGPPLAEDAGDFADLDGLPRVLDGDGDGRALIDAGAVEAGPRPSLAIEARHSAEQDSRVTFTAILDGPWESIEWRFGDGTPPATGGLTVEHDYSRSGAYAVEARVRFLDVDLRAAAEVRIAEFFIRGDCSGDKQRDVRKLVRRSA